MSLEAHEQAVKMLTKLLNIIFTQLQNPLTFWYDDDV